MTKRSEKCKGWVRGHRLNEDKEMKRKTEANINWKEAEYKEKDGKITDVDSKKKGSIKEGERVRGK